MTEEIMSVIGPIQTAGAAVRRVAAVVAAMCLASVSCAIETRVILDDSFSNFVQGESTGTELLSDGFLRVAPEARRLDMTDEAVGWRVAVDRVDGQTFFATGHGGKVYRHVPGAKPEQWAKLPEGQAISLVIDPTGGVLIGASPGGKIYRVVEKGKPQLLFDTKEQYIWDMIFDRDGVLYAATGPNGKIFRVRGANNGEVYYDSDATNVMGLDFDSEGRLLAATQGRGMVLRVSGADEAYVMYTSSDDEVRALASEQATGVLYAAVNGVKASSGLFETAGAEAKSGSVSAGSSAPGSSSSSSSSSRAASSSSYLVQIQPSGFVSKFWPAPEGPIHALMADPSSTGSLLVAAGKKGRIYRVESNTDYSVLADVPEPMVLSMAAGPGGETYFTTANKASLYRLRSDNRGGEFASRALNAGSTVQWGNIALEAEMTSGAKVLVATRSGNTPDPTDKTWSDFTTATLSGDRFAKVQSPVAQYLQYRLTLQAAEGAPGAGPELDGVQIYYVQRNAPPVLRDIKISKSGETGASLSALALLAARRAASASSGAGGPDDDDDSAAASAALRSAASGSSGSSSAIGSSASRSGDGRSAGSGAAPSQNSKRFRIGWEAADPNDDRLLATVWLKAEDETVWRQAEENLSGNSLTIATDSLADGRYRVKVDVSDSPENPEAAATTTTLVSQTFTVDNSNPAILGLAAARTGTAGEWEITAKAEDAASILFGADYALDDVGEFSAVLPEDGIFDFPMESFKFRVKPAEPKTEHVLTFRVYDREGNMQVGKALLK